MANEEHLEILRQRLKVWNEWTKKNYQILKPDLSGINLSDTNFKNTFFIKTDFGDANTVDVQQIGGSIQNSNIEY